jgi:hypothetical protein
MCANALIRLESRLDYFLLFDVSYQRFLDVVLFKDERHNCQRPYLAKRCDQF